MKITAILFLLTCLSPAAAADDLATPSPTPVYIHPFTRRSAVRRAEQIDRRRTRRSEAESPGQTRAKALANRRSASATRAQSKEAARAREQAQREVGIQNRVEAARATPHPASDLMSRMGFGEEEIAPQKAREQPAANEAGATKAQTPSQEPSQTGTGTGATAQHPTPSPASAQDGAQKPINGIPRR